MGHKQTLCKKPSVGLPIVSGREQGGKEGWQKHSGQLLQKKSVKGILLGKWHGYIQGWEELHSYQIQPELWTKCLCIFTAAAAGGMLGYIFRLGLTGSLIMIFGIFLMLPKLIFNLYKSKYEKLRFEDVNIYMEQILYAFREKSKILDSLENIQMLFPNGNMNGVICRSIDMIHQRTGTGKTERLALSMIEERYPCSRLRVLHDFMLNAEEVGGEFASSFRLLLKERNMWSDRMDALEGQRKKYQRDILISVLLSFAVCAIGMHMLPGEVDISRYLVIKIGSVGLIWMNLFIFSCSLKKNAESLLQEEDENTGIIKKYERCMSFNQRKEMQKSLAFAIFPAVVCLVLAVNGFWGASVFSLLAAFLLLFQHRLGYFLAKKELMKQIHTAFPEWLMQLGLLLQSENVQVSFLKSLEHAPSVLKPEIRKLIAGLEASPESEEPFLLFLKNFTNGEITAAMRMLYAVSAGTGADPAAQISDIIERNQAVYDRMSRLKDNDRLAGLYILFLAPSVIGMLKLSADMTVFMMAYFSAISF